MNNDLEDDPKNEDYLKYEYEPKNEGGHENEDDLKNERNLKNENDLKKRVDYFLVGEVSLYKVITYIHFFSPKNSPKTHFK